MDESHGGIDIFIFGGPCHVDHFGRSIRVAITCRPLSKSSLEVDTACVATAISSVARRHAWTGGVHLLEELRTVAFAGWRIGVDRKENPSAQCWRIGVSWCFPKRPVAFRNKGGEPRGGKGKDQDLDITVFFAGLFVNSFTDFDHLL